MKERAKRKERPRPTGACRQSPENLSVKRPSRYMISRTNVGVGNLRRVYLHFGNFHRARVHAGMLRPRRRRARSLVTSTAIVRLAR